MPTGQQIAQTTLEAYSCDGGYIWGQQGAEWTAAKQASLEKRYNADPQGMSKYKSSVQYGKQWIGHRVWDCAGLCRDAAAKNGISIHSGSNLIWDCDLSEKGALTRGMKLPVGALVFCGTATNKSHVGTYTGDNLVTEASSPRVGVIQSTLDCGKWKYWGLEKGVTYDFTPVPQPDPEKKHKTIKKGSTGPDVVECQQDLIQLGYDVGRTGADGIYGQKTADAVTAFQKDHGLTADGICGPKTWDALDAAIDNIDPAPDPAPDLYTVTIQHLSLQEAEEITAKYGGSIAKE